MTLCSVMRTSTTFDGGSSDIGEIDLRIRKENLRAVLSALGKRWPLGGVDSEGGELVGKTQFWAKPGVRSPVMVFSIPNRILNRRRLTREQLDTYVDSVRVR